MRAEKHYQITVVERAEWMAAESAARALGILARWATRRLERRANANASSIVKDNVTNDYMVEDTTEQT